MRKRNFFNIGVMTVCAFSVRILGMAYKMFLAGRVSPVALGIYQLVMPVYGCLSSVICSGLPLAVQKLTAETKNANGVLASALKLASVPLAFITLLLLFGNNLISGIFLNDPKKGILILSLIPAVTLGAAADIYAGALHGTGKSYYPAICTSIEQLAKIVFAVITVSLFAENTESDALFPVLALSFGGTVSYLLLRLKVGKLDRHSAGYQKRVFQTAYPPTLSRLFTTILHLCTTSVLPHRLMHYGLSRSSALSQYGILTSIAYPVIYLPMTLLGPVATVTLVQTAENLNGFKAIRKEYLKRMAFAFAVTVTFSVFLLLFAPYLSDKIFSQPLAGKYSVMLIPSVVFSGLNVITFSTLNGLGKQKALMLLSLFDGLCGLMLTYFLAGSFGIEGFIAGNCIQDMTAFIMGTVIISKERNK